MIYNEEYETMPREALEAIQLRRLQTTVTRVYSTVPFYRNRFDEMGLKPQDVNSLADIHKLPFTYKNDLRDNYPFGMFTVPMDSVVRIHASSGTTGQPTVVGFTARDIQTWSELMARTLMAGGATKGDMIHNAYGYGLFTGGLGFHYGAEKLGASVIPAATNVRMLRGDWVHTHGAVLASVLHLLAGGFSTGLVAGSHCYESLRLTQSAISVDSFSLYNKAGFVPRYCYQDMMVEVPAGGFAADVPGMDRVRPATLDDVSEMAGLELEVSAITRVPTGVLALAPAARQTVTPFLSAASRSMPSTPVPFRLMTLRSPAASSTVAEMVSTPAR